MCVYVCVILGALTTELSPALYMFYSEAESCEGPQAGFELTILLPQTLEQLGS